jgi:hypothetical protein
MTRAVHRAELAGAELVDHFDVEVDEHERGAERGAEGKTSASKTDLARPNPPARNRGILLRTHPSQKILQPEISEPRHEKCGESLSKGKVPDGASRGSESEKIDGTEGSSTENPESILLSGKGRYAIGLDPREIPVEALTAAGHPPRRTGQLVSAFVKWVGEAPFDSEFQKIKGHKHIRGYCLRCVENTAEVQRSTTVLCPFWPYRMGCNPHNPRRGKDPFNRSVIDKPRTPA